MRKADEPSHFFFGWFRVYIYALESAELKHECKSVVKAFTTAF